jgi:PmbA protein
MMLGESRVKGVLERILSLSTADQTEAIFLSTNNQLTRFANSYIHQNVASLNTEIAVRVVLGKKVGIAAANSPEDGALAQVVEAATSAARYQRENPDFISLPSPKPIPGVNAFVEATAAFTPEARAKAVGAICRRASELGLNASGAFTSAYYELAVANSLGVFAYYPSTLADLETVAMGDSGSGYAASTSTDVRQIDAEALGREAIEKAIRGRDPVGTEPGEYTVILEEYAIEELLFYLAFMGLGALSVQEKRSFMTGKFGQRIVGENISIWDDGLDPGGLPTPFDYEGVPKRKVDLIKEGIASGVVYDSYTGGREKVESTGHALPPGNTIGPLPANRFLGAGQASREEMLASIDKGIWVTRLWYVNPVHPLKTVITGMTRDGTFLIERGELGRPVKNLRFTQSTLDILSRTHMISRETKLLKSDRYGCSRIPAIKVEGFTFTGATEF